MKLLAFCVRELGELPIAKLLHRGERNAGTNSCLLPDGEPIGGGGSQLGVG